MERRKRGVRAEILNRWQDGKEGMRKTARKLVGFQLVLVERQRRGRVEKYRQNTFSTGLYARGVCDQGYGTG